MLLDNGRTAALADPAGREALHCIRCSACLNVCPVYERTGGHAYGSVYPGPIGAVLSPQLTGVEENASLPYASSLCGACYDVCPVKINIPELLVHLRARHVEEARLGRRLPSAEAVAMAAASWVLADSRPARGSTVGQPGRAAAPAARRDLRAAAAAGRLDQGQGCAAATTPDLPAVVAHRARRTRTTGIRTTGTRTTGTRHDRAGRGAGPHQDSEQVRRSRAGRPAQLTNPPRGYRTRGELSGRALLDLLAARLADYRAIVHVVTPGDAAGARSMPRCGAAAPGRWSCRPRSACRCRTSRLSLLTRANLAAPVT